jgi:hypothetical protein
MSRRATFIGGWLALTGLASLVLFYPAGPAEAQVKKGPFRHGLGGKKKVPHPDRILTPARYQAILKTPSANPHLLRVRAERSGFHPPKALLKLTSIKITPGKGRPRVIDWRTRFGTNWITKVADQGNTENCWAFASNALVEAMVRIEHGVWTRRAVVELRKGVRKKVTDGGNPAEALLWAHEHGLADPDCSPYSTDDLPLRSSPDRDGRTVRLPNKHVRIPNDAGQASAKRWLDTVGPVVAWMECFTDFTSDAVSGGKVYRKSRTAKSRGGHLVLVVGYDDDRGCWICKNSWGAGWGDNGYFRIAYGECGIDSDPKYGLRMTNPDPWTRRRLHNGTMLESGNGTLHRNFEMLGQSGQALKHWWRQGGENGDLGWRTTGTFAKDVATRPSLAASTYNRNFEAVYVSTTGRLRHWTFDQKARKWQDHGVFGPAKVAGIPGLIQGNNGVPGAFEVVVRTPDGKVSHWWRTNKAPFQWKHSTDFGKDVAYSGASLIQSQRGVKGNLSTVVVLKDGRMQLWERPSLTTPWRATQTFGAKVNSSPCLIEGQFGARDEDTAGNWELCVAAHGKVEHWWRNNQGDRAWRRSAVFGSNVKAVAALVEGSFGFNLEVIVLRTDNRLQHYWRQGATWNAGVIIG